MPSCCNSARVGAYSHLPLRSLLGTDSKRQDDVDSVGRRVGFLPSEPILRTRIARRSRHWGGSAPEISSCTHSKFRKVGERGLGRSRGCAGSDVSRWRHTREGQGGGRDDVEGETASVGGRAVPKTFVAWAPSHGPNEVVGASPYRGSLPLIWKLPPAALAPSLPTPGTLPVFAGRTVRIRCQLGRGPAAEEYSTSLAMPRASKDR